MSEQKGLYNKYTLINNETGETVEGPFFVLKPKKDMSARMAIKYYANHTDNRSLANDIFAMLEELRSQSHE